MLGYSDHTQQTDTQLEALIGKYEHQQRPISVDFRKMVHWLSSPERFTHLIHPYPAKLLVHIPYFFLANQILSKPGDTVFDPFCGSGTVLLESQLSGRSALGVDSNPLARLISTVKTRPISTDKLRDGFFVVMQKIPSKPRGTPPDVVNLEYWFYPHVIKQLQRLLEGIKTVSDPCLRDFFRVCFSFCVRKVSLADPRLTVPVRLRQGQYPEGHPLRGKTDAHLRRLKGINVREVFEGIVTKNLQRMETLSSLPKDCQTQVICSDARHLSYEFSNNGSYNEQIPDGSIQLVITSPPYAGAQKYIRSVSLSLGWLELCSAKEISTYKDATIGREQYRKADYAELIRTGVEPADELLTCIREMNPLRAHIAANYLVEMRSALSEIARVLQPYGYLVLVAANNQVCGQNFKTSEYLRRLAEQLGFSLKLCLIDDIRSRGLMTKRNKTASVISREWIMLFQKG